MKNYLPIIMGVFLVSSLSVSIPAYAQDDETYNPETDFNKLRDYADAIGKNIGVCLPSNIFNYSEGNEAILAYRTFNMVVAENEMKMDATEPSQNSFNFTNGDNLVKFAQAHNMKVRGHCLVWHSQVPKWISSDGYENDKNWTREQLLAILKRHIMRVAVHFHNKVTEWDVVNECLADWQSSNPTLQNGKYTLRNSIWATVIGEDFLDSAFVWAHKYDSNAKLYLNDYGADHYDTSGKAQALYNLARRLKNSGIPIDGVGLQCHLDVGDNSLSKVSLNMNRFMSGLKLNCIITELDLGTDKTDDATYATQAANYQTLLAGVLKRDNCPTMMIWGIDDNHTWRSNKHPLLFDTNRNAKPAYYSMLTTLHTKYKELEASAISDVEIDEGEKHFTPGFIYSITGQRLGYADKYEDLYLEDRGVYIVNGMKFYIK